jgi:ABC-type amino acid transport substrate-binding protein
VLSGKADFGIAATTIFPERASKVAEAFYTVTPEEVEAGKAVRTLQEDVYLALDGLKVNYRVGWPEVNALGIFDTAAVTQILCALIDYPTFRKMMEDFAAKKAEAPASS